VAAAIGRAGVLIGGHAVNPAQSDPSLAAALPVPRAFAPRPVSIELTGRLARRSFAVLRAAPGRLLLLYLFVYLPLLLLLTDAAYLAMPLRGVLASIGFAGFYGALQRAADGEAPGLREMVRPWLLPADRIVLLALAGLLPVLAIWLVWWFDLGSAGLDGLLSVPLGAAPADAKAGPASPALAQLVEMIAVENLLNLPLLLLQPLCVLHDWSATRTLSANLLASLANWRWGVLLAMVAGPLALALNAAPLDNPAVLPLVLVADVGFGMFLSAFTLVLLQYTLDGEPAALATP